MNKKHNRDYHEQLSDPSFFYKQIQVNKQGNEIALLFRIYVALMGLINVFFHVVGRIIFFTAATAYQFDINAPTCMHHHACLVLGALGAMLTIVVEPADFPSRIGYGGDLDIFQFQHTYFGNPELNGDRSGSNHYASDLVCRNWAMLP